MTRRSGQSDKQSRPGRLRIVAGKWRSRLLQIADDPALRPTAERVRETLFNWLAPQLAGARCLDLFAGTGALGLEALSRGAAEVVFVENSPRAVATLKQNVATLAATGASILTTDSMRYLRDIPAKRFDVVFLDPPYAADMYDELCRLLHENAWCAAEARIFLEQPRDAEMPALPDGWEILKDKTAGNVRYCLLKATRQ